VESEAAGDAARYSIGDTTGDHAVMSDPTQQPGPPSAKEIFGEAMELPPAQREAFVESRCGGDAQLLASVKSLLAAAQRAGNFLSDPTVEHGQTAKVTDAQGRSQMIGPYKLLQTIGEGGFGTVYMAEQEHPVRRQVALKLIKLGMDTKQVIARFEAERQALAMMDHPNIARVLDAGATETGRPYFVMELVRGVPVTEYCDTNKLTPRQRLELFVPICQAVQHAHQKGIIHRDIKPSNVLVTLHDARPVPKVIDFGIAKAISQRLTEKTIFTEFRQMIGTPEYMSPEQAEISGLDIDTRTDVYSLGVLLYQLLTGLTPFDARDLRSKAYAEMQRIIREVDPPAPSTRVSTNENLPSIAAQRNVEPRKLTATVRGELDWIVMKCLEKDRTRRYDSPSALAGDISHYLADEPVAASPPSTAYRFRKFVRRNRALVTAGSIVLMVLLAGIAGTTWGLLEARQQRDAAILARNQAEVARNQAETARQAEAEAREYESQTDKFLVAMFESIDPQQSRGKPVLVKDIVDSSTRLLDAQPPTHRKAEGSLRIVFAIAYNALGMLEQARTQYEKAAQIYLSEWGESNFRTSKALNALGQTELELGRLDEAQRHLGKAIEIARKTVGPDSAETIAAENAMAALLIERGKFDDAGKLLAELLPRVRRVKGEDSEDTMTVLSMVTTLKIKQGKYAEAEQLLRSAIEIWRKSHGEDHPYTLALMNNLADMLRTQGRVADAEPIQRQCLDIGKRVFGADHPTTLTLANNLALSLDALRKFQEAEPIYLDVIERRRRILGEDHNSTLTARNNYALLMQNTGRLPEAEAVFRDLVDRSMRVNGANHENTLLWTNNLAWLLVARDDPPAAEALYRDLVPRTRQALGPKHPMTASFSMRYGYVLARQDRNADAEPMLAEAYAAANELGIAATQSAYSTWYGLCLDQLGKHAEALPVLIQADQALQRAPVLDVNSRRRVIEALVRCYEQFGQNDNAEKWRQQLQALSASTTTSAPSSQPQ
jgi:serine/threonine protein kinase/tetratricopeptide (TPR) repeat protein